METVFYATAPIIIALLIGYLVGKNSPQKILHCAGKLIGPLVWLLLLSIGVEFAQVFKDPATVGKSIYLASIFAILSTFTSCLLIYLYFYKYTRQAGSRASAKGPATLLAPLKECALAFSMVVIGVLLSSSSLADTHIFDNIAVTDILLYSLVFFVGIDIVGVKITSAWCSIKVVVIPFLVIAGSLIGGLLASFIAHESINTSLALVSGFGWFTLSGVLVSSKLGAVYGTVALLTDLFRELLAILLLYLLGHKFSRECIGAGAATTLDSTLPIIKQTCSSDNIPTALVSGFILTLLAPVLITFLLSVA